MKNLLGKVLLVVCLLSSTAIAGDMYVKGNLGFGSASGDSKFFGSTDDATHEIDGNSGVSYGISFGYKISDTVRIDLEHIIVSSDIENIESTKGIYPVDGITLDSSFTMINIYHDWDNWYVGAGVGTVSTDVSAGAVGTTSADFSSGSGAGSAFGLSLGYKNDIDKKLFYDVTLKYLTQSGSVNTKGTTISTVAIDYEPTYFIATLGIGYKF